MSQKCIDEACRIDEAAFARIKRPAIKVPMEFASLSMNLLYWDVPRKPRKHRKTSSTSFKRRKA